MDEPEDEQVWKVEITVMEDGTEARQHKLGLSQLTEQTHSLGVTGEAAWTGHIHPFIPRTFLLLFLLHCLKFMQGSGADPDRSTPSQPAGERCPSPSRSDLEATTYKEGVIIQIKIKSALKNMAPLWSWEE